MVKTKSAILVVLWFICKVTLLLEVLVTVGEKHLIYQYIFITLVKRSQNALQTKPKSLFCILYQECPNSPGSDLIFHSSFAAVEFALFYAVYL